MAAMRARLAKLVEAVTTTERWAELMEESATKLVGEWRTRLSAVLLPRVQFRCSTLGIWRLSLRWALLSSHNLKQPFTRSHLLDP
jgi:hypothetical protein